MQSLSNEQLSQVHLSEADVSMIKFGLDIIGQSRRADLSERDGTTVNISSFRQKLDRNPEAPKLTKNEILLAIEGIAYGTRISGYITSAKPSREGAGYFELIRKLGEAL